MSRNEKKSKFTETKKSNNGIYVITGIIIIALLAVGAYTFTKKPSAAANVGAVSYQTAEFAKVSAAEANGDIVVDMKELNEKKTVTFDVKGISFTLNNGTKFNDLPIMAFVSPSGDVVVATSLCEPCSGTTFHVEGDKLVCNTCGTRWTLDGLKGVDGGCLTYPPETVKYTVQGDKLIIKKTDLQNWKPRAV